jgi:serine phosphatase RsbU (regulator of sigma subunit)
MKLGALQAEYADLQTAIGEAAQVYRRLCAPRLVRRGKFEIASETFAVRHVPGDFFAVEETGGEIVLALGDISGKGLGAGMWTTFMVGLVNTHVAANPEPHTVAARINEDLCRMRAVAPLASLFLARLNPFTGRLDYTNAGHPPALLLRANGELELLSDGGLLLGVVSAADFSRGTVYLNAGDVLLVCSDGILESVNEGDQEFGYSRLEAQLRSARTGAAGEVLFSVLGAVQDFAATRTLVDDMSLAVVRRDSR